MSIPRTLEVEVMDTPQEALDYNRMDHAEVNRLFAADLRSAGFDGGDVLDVGTGTALIPIEICQQAKTGPLSRRMRIMAVDLEMFDVVISNSIVHHIPEPARVIAECVRVLRPGGLMFIRDLMRPQTEEQVRHFVQQYTGQENPHSQQMFGDSLRAALTLEEIRQLVVAAGAPASSVQATSDRHWTWSWRKPEQAN
ncbi:MAG: methyltransferase domain-containing protein [Blastopirellula sp.]|nr:methyltransferase domain-containing protein [Blastopirellula sp.]